MNADPGGAGPVKAEGPSKTETLMGQFSEGWDALVAECDRYKERADRERERADRTAWSLRDTRVLADRYKAALEDLGRYLAVIPWEPSVGEALATVERALSPAPQEGESDDPYSEAAEAFERQAATQEGEVDG